MQRFMSTPSYGDTAASQLVTSLIRDNLILRSAAPAAADPRRGGGGS